ncbi:MAG: Asp-tRNA(Asn)/Glu-tRNA(Gln) amidotransferase subunit GatB [Anaerolineales bacterium]|nr:Asp-tRNA(Asn)/Glu-tRNA(Gln) amidotransferase subunit GatB [Anaerolineales bacterium]
MQQYEAVIGLEVHAELQTQTKMFCSCPVIDSTSAAPNTAVCEICSGMPGTLPVINAQAVSDAVKVGLALNCTIAATSVFARKNYFYPDLPKGYQISQYELPLAQNGWLDISLPSGLRRIRINRCHLEEDTGKLTHVEGASLVDLNRSGVPLLEIVSEPDMHSVEDVKAYATTLRTLLQYLHVNSGDMEKGVIRFEANVSVRPQDSTELGTRTEIKNLNSFHALTHGVAYEIDRQSALLRENKKVQQQTLGWDPVEGKTVPQRSKEEAHDYRYFPEPDLPPLVLEETFIENIRSHLPELPGHKKQRFLEQYHLNEYIASVLTTDCTTADYFEAAVQAFPSNSAENIANWLIGDLFSLLNQAGISISDCPISPYALSDLVALVEKDLINGTTARQVLADMFVSGSDPHTVVEQKGLRQISGEEDIEPIVQQVLADSPEQVQTYLEGKKTLQQWFFGQVMRSAQGRAKPEVVKKVLAEHLQILEKNHLIE